MHSIFPKTAIEDLSIFGGSRLFDPPISTSNLVKPDIERFLEYSRLFIQEDGYQSDGAVIRLMEQRFAAFHQVSHCITVSNGFWALVMAIKSLAIQHKTEVIMPSLTYRRLADVVAWTGLKPHFCEVDPNTLAISPQSVEDAINSETALILGVHPIVNVCDVNGLVAIAEKSGIPLLFDAVESVYETINGKKVGSFGHAECFSLHASKLINGFEGGYITTDDALLAQRLTMMRDCGLDAEGKLRFLGINAKLSEVHAAMALANLDDLEAQVERNRQRYHLYKTGLADIPGLHLLTFDESEKTSFKTIVVKIGEAWPLSRAQTIDLLNQEGVLCRAYYAPALHAKPMQYPFVPAQLPLTDQLSQQFMLMPCGHLVDDDQLAHLFKLLRFIYEHAHLIKGAWQCVGV